MIPGEEGKGDHMIPGRRERRYWRKGEGISHDPWGGGGGDHMIPGRRGYHMIPREEGGGGIT